MYVPDRVLKCVGFVGYQSQTARPLAGTVFLASVPIEGDYTARFAVTAAHVLDEIAARTMDGNVYLRFSERGGGLCWITTRLADWMRHPTDPIVDCAVVPLPIPDHTDVLTYPVMTSSATDGTFRVLRLGIGDEVFITGLFKYHYGTEQNIPIVRTGNIAAMPSEKVATERGPMDAFLIEARSIGGLSGSPVFVQFPTANPFKVKTIDGEKVVQERKALFFFLGLIHGHYDVKTPADRAVEDGLDSEAINMGIAIVVPATQVIEVLGQPKVQAMIAEWRKQTAGESPPTRNVAAERQLS